MSCFKAITGLLCAFAIAACSTTDPVPTSDPTVVVEGRGKVPAVPDTIAVAQLTTTAGSCADLSVVSRQAKNQQLCRLLSCNQSLSTTDLMRQLDILLPDYTFQDVVFAKTNDSRHWSLACNISDSDGQNRFFRASNSFEIPDRVSRTINNYSDQTWFIGSGIFDFDFETKNPLDLGTVYFRKLAVLNFAEIADDYKN